MESAGTQQRNKQTLRGCTIMMMPRMLSIEQHVPPVGSPRRAAMSAASSIAPAPWWAGRRGGGWLATSTPGHSQPPNVPMLMRRATPRAPDAQAPLSTSAAVSELLNVTRPRPPGRKGAQGVACARARTAWYLSSTFHCACAPRAPPPVRRLR